MYAQTPVDDSPPLPHASLPPCCRAVRDALAEARGCVRIVLKVRPLLQGDLLAASHSGVQLRMLAAAWAAARASAAAPAVAASHSATSATPRGRELDAALSAMSLEALAVVLGWSPSALEAFRATLDRAASIPGYADRDGAYSPQLAAVDIAPSVVSSGTSLDGGKQFVVAPAPLSLQDFGSVVLTAAQTMGTLLPVTDVFMDAIQQSLRRASQFSFDRVYGGGVGSSGKDDEEDLSAGEAAEVALSRVHFYCSLLLFQRSDHCWMLASEGAT